jgi:hypothetical protein
MGLPASLPPSPAACRLALVNAAVCVLTICLLCCLAALVATPPLQVDYYLALRCQQFIGNSVSVFSALLIMERWHAGQYATYYNGGNIPLENFVPLFP